MKPSSQPANPGVLTAREIVNLIESRVPPPAGPGTVDTFKCGDPDRPVRGIATAFTASCAVLEKAAAAGANFVITHEPTFYNHRDETDWLENDPVSRAKRKLISDHGLVLWRFHDGWHRIRPDGILSGEEKQLGWESFRVPGEERVYQLPRQSLRELAGFLKKSLNIATVRVAGDLEMECSCVAFLPGAPGGRKQIEFLFRPEVQVVIGGESPEWETCEYVRDALALGQAKALIVLGHANSEEAGMAWFAEWLRPLLPPEIPVTHLIAGDPFQFA